MPLIIDRLPLHIWTDPLTRQERLAVVLPVVVCDPGLSHPPASARPQRWFVDTRFTGEAFAWRHHLEEAGLNVQRHRGGHVLLTPLLGSPQPFPVRSADLWLASNRRGLRGFRWPIPLDRGIAFHN